MTAPRSTQPLELLITLPAVATSAGGIRRRIRPWLTGLGWPEDELDDIVMAVDEAVANVVDHAYPPGPATGDVHVYAWIATAAPHRRVVVSITDRGRWRPVPQDNGNRGRGLLVMRTCMATLHIERTSGGTAVTMTSAPIPCVEAEQAVPGRG